MLRRNDRRRAMLRFHAVRAAPFSPEATGAEVYTRFKAEPDAQVYAVVDADGRVLGLIERQAFTLRMAAEFGRALYAGRPVSHVMDPAPMSLDAELPLTAAVEGLLGPGVDPRRGFVVLDQGRYFGVGTAVELLRAVSAANARNAAELQDLAAGLDESRRAAERARDMLNHVTDAMVEGLAYWDRNDRLQLWNRRYAELNVAAAPLEAGLPYAEMIGRMLRAGVVGPLDSAAADAWIKARKAERARPIHVRELQSDGRWLRVTTRRLEDGGVLATVSDVTEARAREESFKLLFDANPVPMCVVDRETLAVLRVNDAAVEQLGFETGAFERITDVLAPDQRQAAADRIAASERSTDTVYEVRGADGRFRKVLPYRRPTVYDGRPALLVAAVDMTVRFEAEAESRRARDAAEAASRAKSEFLANMSHEIRTPLNGVIAVADLLARSDLGSKDRDMVETIRASGATLERLLTDLLDLSRVEAGRIALEVAPFDPARAVREACNAQQFKAEEKGLAFDLEVASDVPGWVAGDAVRFKQVVGNLVSNAVKFTETGGVRVRLDRADDGRLRVAVEDTGVGFDAGAGARLFDRFAQADGSITRRFGGSGLGLAICRELAELMGGRIEATSEPGVGSVFTVVFALPAADPVEAPQVVHGEEVAVEGLKVLVVDDHETNRKVAGMLLAQAGLEAVFAENGREALDRIERERFDLVLMDMQMPVMDGLTAVAHVRRREAAEGARRLPIVMLTANALPEHVAAATAAGADAHLAKPIAIGPFFSLLERLLSERTQTQAAAA
jgi:PAS domain S-box-containing protein